MTPADLLAWQAHMGLSQRAAADALGVTHATYSGWVLGKVPIKPVVALACAAIFANLPAWSESKHVDSDGLGIGLDLADAELTKLSAQAMGCSIDGWSPLTDSAQCFDLAVHLDIQVEQNTCFRRAAAESMCLSGASFGGEFFEPWGNDKKSATRRVIVRAAVAQHLFDISRRTRTGIDSA